MAYRLTLDLIESQHIIFDNYPWVMFFLITAGERKYRHLDCRASGVIDQMFNKFYENAMHTAMKIGVWNTNNLHIIPDKDIEPEIARYPSYLRIYLRDLGVIRKMDIEVGIYSFKKIFFWCGENDLGAEGRIIYTLIAGRKLLQVAENDIETISEHFEEYREEYKNIPAGLKMYASR